MSTRTLLRSLLAASTATAALALTACGAVKPADGGGSDDGSFKVASHIQKRIDGGKPMRIKLSYHDPSLAFATPIGVGMKKAGKKFGAETALIGPTGGDAAQQVSEIQTLIQQKAVDGLAVSSASSDALKPVIAQAYNAGIPLISFNTDNPGSKQMGFVGQDLKASGKSQAEQLLKDLGGTKKGKVVVFSVDTGAGWSHDRFGGFKEGMAKSGLEIVGPVNVGNEPSAAYNTVESTMSGQSGVVGVAGLVCCSLGRLLVRFEHSFTFTNVAAGERVRWLPRRQASDLALPGNDFWLFDGKLVQFNIFDGVGRWVHTDQTEDPAMAAHCAAAFEAVWERGIPHEKYTV